MKRLLVKAFTLIELMIVVAIVAILAAIAIPAYQNYTAKAQLAEAFAFADHSKTAVQSYIQGGGTADLTTANVGLDSNAAGTYVSSVAVTGITSAPVITVTMSPITSTVGIAAKEASAGAIANVIFTGTTSNGVITWACTTTNIPQKYLPATCLGS